MNSSKTVPDLRIRRTHKLLWQALTTLMEKQDFEAITVTDICDGAMVHRTTFYKHFEDKYALLQRGVEEQIQLLFEALNLAEAKPTVSMDQANVRFYLVQIFAHVAEFKAFYRLMLGRDGVGKFNVLFNEALVDYFLAHAAALPLHSGKRDENRKVLRAHIHAGVLTSAIAWWLDNNCPYTADEMGGFLVEDAFSVSNMP